jgi:hypothetical protein
MRAILVIAIALSATPAAAQQKGKWVVPRTADGRPDFQGNWSNATLTPIERLPGVGAVLTAEQVAMAEGRLKSRIDSLSKASDPNRPAPPAGGVSLGDARFDAASGGTGGYNVFFIDAGNRIAIIDGEARSSIIAWPATGKVPPLTDAARRDSRRSAPAGHVRAVRQPGNRPLAERCIISFGSNAGPPMLPNYFYNNNYTIVQTRDYVLIYTEMVHDARHPHLTGPAPAHDAHGGFTWPLGRRYLHETPTCTRPRRDALRRLRHAGDRADYVER